MMKQAPHVTSIKKQFALNKLSAAHRMHIVDGRVEKYEAELPEQDIEEVLANYMEPGQLVEGRGIFVGTWEPEDEGGTGLSQIFNVFAAPEDLGGTQKWYKYNEALEKLATLKDWHGYDGTDYATDKELREALWDGTYSGGWVIPPREILCGAKSYSEDTQPDNLLAHRNVGAFKGAYDIQPDDYDGFPNWYWSSTRHPRMAQATYLAGFILAGRADWRAPNIPGPCRPVRMEPKP